MRKSFWLPAIARNEWCVANYEFRITHYGLRLP